MFIMDLGSEEIKAQQRHKVILLNVHVKLSNVFRWQLLSENLFTSYM